MNTSDKKLLVKLLIFSLVIIYFQVIVGGITRLTESGLSMTDWKVVTGSIPPMSQEAWDIEFKNYQESPEYKEINEGMSLTEFKSIFFWEWLHRVWGRWGFVFLFGIFAYFLAKKKLDRKHIGRFSLLLLLYIAQGLLGWFMVKSGLVDRPEVSHYRLTAHLLLAIFLFAYVLWYVSDLVVESESKIYDPQMQRFAWILVGVLVLQIMFGGFMSGLKAASHYPSFPDMNGAYIPHNLFEMQPFWMNFTEHIPTIQFTHRGIAYLLVVLILTYGHFAKRLGAGHPFFRQVNLALPFVLITQVLLGIFTLLNSLGSVPVFLGVAHQACGLLLLSTMLLLAFQYGKNGKVS
ncbi:MAG: COX15/CtaA family protein [Chitinophagales bacterium]